MAIHALHIGLNYKGTGNDLSKCVNDAKAMKSIFGGKLLTGKIGRDRLLSEVRKCIDGLGKGEWAVITFSGHGTQIEDTSGDEPDGLDECICTHEKDGDLDVVVDDEWQDVLRCRHGGRVLGIMDSCFSGTGMRAAPLLLRSHQPRARRMRYLPHTALSSAVRRRRQNRVRNSCVQRNLPNVCLLSGCTDFEYSYEGSKYGVLTGAVYECYRRGLSLRQLRDNVYRAVQKGDYGRIQHPQMTCSAAMLNLKVPEQ